jgi:hypothetical protein
LNGRLLTELNTSSRAETEYQQARELQKMNQLLSDSEAQLDALFDIFTKRYGHLLSFRIICATLHPMLIIQLLMEMLLEGLAKQKREHL